MRFLYRSIGWSPDRRLLMAWGRTRAESIASLVGKGADVVPHPAQSLGRWRRGTMIERLEKGVDFTSPRDLPLAVIPEGTRVR